MKKLLRKFKSKRGESFIEVLIAILIAAFGCVIIAVMFTTSMSLNVQASKEDDAFYDALSKTEQMFDSGTGTAGNVVVKDEYGNEMTDGVLLYGDEEHSAYKRD